MLQTYVSVNNVNISDGSICQSELISDANPNYVISITQPFKFIKQTFRSGNPYFQITLTQKTASCDVVALRVQDGRRLSGTPEAGYEYSF